MYVLGQKTLTAVSLAEKVWKDLVAVSAQMFLRARSFGIDPE